MAYSGSAGRAIELSVILVSYNTRDLTLACLDSLVPELAELPSPAEVLVVDNGSRDGSVVAISAHPLRPTILSLGDNVGFAQANNRAACRARGRYLLLLNSDTRVGAHAVANLLAFAAARPGAGIWGGRTLFPDGRLNPASCWGQMTPWTLFCRAAGLAAIFASMPLFNGESYAGWDRDSIREVDIVSGCFMLVSRKLWDDLGGFDPQFFMYGEDADLCLRARHLGARPAITPEATIVHLGGASEPTRSGKMQKLLMAKATLIRRHWSPWVVPLGSALLQVWPLTRILAWALRASLAGSAEACAATTTWGEIWSTRRTWRLGYGVHVQTGGAVVPGGARPAATTIR